jgi:N-acetyl-1-D-myo-inositol-2-amino-2-deoxy-alpha-D-glucopyranoside deacetylase
VDAGKDRKREVRLPVVVAHPDDETFGCGSLLAHAATRQVSTVVVCATRGEAGNVRPASEQVEVSMTVSRSYLAADEGGR